ncbi:hypothetical protein HU200_046178 [Digitaria exilis]|uniref:Uncharacterized protein n=1 Tax=Digitaria exilis TaxID=1010633 RepID=A0A835EDX7_9POAL|nr:hypothetical protein HU200_046178 [Digitaria exilis]
MQGHNGRALLALCLLLCLASCQGRTSPGVEGEGAAQRVSPAGGRVVVVALVHKLPEVGLPVSGGARAERLLRSVPSPGVGH